MRICGIRRAHFPDASRNLGLAPDVLRVPLRDVLQQGVSGPRLEVSLGGVTPKAPDWGPRPQPPCGKI
jgi:hypothetical protein